MLDKVVRLRKGGAGDEKLKFEAGLGGQKIKLEAGFGGEKVEQPQPAVPQGPYDVTVRLEARAPQGWDKLKGQCQLKVWDPFGRNPTRLPDFEIGTKPSHDWPLKKSLPDLDLDGRTLTWWIRFAPSAATSFELELEVLQGNTSVGKFSYSGPLEPGEFEERDGRFHFKVVE